MTPIERAKSMFPNMPDEVFNLWLAPLIINDIGWPFHAIEDSTADTNWFRILHPYSLSVLSQLKWDLDSFLINKNVFCPLSNADINLIILNKSFDIQAFIVWDSESSRRTLAWHKEFIEITGGLCAPIAAVFTPSGIKVFDGHHRIAALLDLDLYDSIAIDAWIGT